jgi:hypothetical protein
MTDEEHPSSRKTSRACVFFTSDDKFVTGQTP